MRGNIDSVGDMFALTAAKYPDKTALVFQDERFTYGELNARVNRLARALTAAGVRKGDKVAFLFMNSPEFVVTWLAVAKAGAVGVPLNYGLVPRELKYQIGQADAVAIVFSPLFMERILAIRDDLPQVRTYLCNGENGTLDFETLSAGYPPDEPEVDVSLYDANLILYTAGTTGVPKGAVLTHRNSLFNAFTCCLDYRFTCDDVLQIVPPLFHAAAVNCMLLPGLVLGCTIAIHLRFDPEDMLRTIQQEAVTVTWGPAILWRTLLAYPDFAKYDVRSVRLLGNGGMAMPGEMREKLLAHFPCAAMMDIYGMTELSPAATLLRPEAALAKPLSVGTPMTLTDVRIFDWRGREAAVGEVGEIAVRGNALDGYYKMPEETGQAVKGGFFRTGDLGKRDEDGFITLVDRKRDVITTGGEQVYSREVEEVLQANPRIKESAVIGVADEKWGERVVAIVSLRQETTPDALLAWCRENLAAYKCPRQIHIVNDIPRNAAGKVVKGELRKRFG